MQLASNDKTVGELKFPVSRERERERERAWRVSQPFTDEKEKRLEETGKGGKDKEEGPGLNALCEV